MSKLTLDEAIKHCLEVAEQNETQAEKIGRQFIGSAMDKRATDCRECSADHRQLAEWLKELKNLREENKVLISECDRLIKEKGELLKKLEPITEYRRLLKIAVEDMGVTVAKVYNGGLLCKCCKWKSQTGECCCPDDHGCDVAYQWRYADEAQNLLNDEKINNVE